MIKIKETIIVEGTYDKIKLSQIIDATIITTDGFDIFKNKSKVNLIKKIAMSTGILILTDSDRAGFLIRNYIKKCIPTKYIKHAYIPEIKGVEKRKTSPGKEGLIGVEGINNDIIKETLKKSGCIIEQKDEKEIKGREITKTDFYNDGFSGRSNSSILRKKLTHMLGLPSRISTNSLLDVLNTLYSYQEYQKLLERLS